MPATLTVRRARVAVAALFLTNGAMFANVVPRIPEFKTGLELSNTALGTALAAGTVGAVLAGFFAAGVIRRLRSARVAAFGMVLLAPAFTLLALAPNGLVLAGVLFVASAVDSVVDVAQNAHGLRVQRIYGRSIVNSFHGLWSVGCVAGGVMGSAAAGLRIPLALHLGVAGALISVIVLVAYRYTLPGPDDRERPAASTTGPSPARRLTGTAVRMLAALGLLAACGALVEDAGASWGAIYLRDNLHTGAATAGLAFVALQAAMTLGRLLGDRVVNRFGQRTVVRTGGLLTAAGLGGALAWPTVGTTLAGFALAGLGAATLVPAAMHTADELPGLPPGVGLTVVSWLLRIGFLVSPPLIGLLADLSSLRVGLLAVVLGGVVTAILGRVLLNRAAPAGPA
ncbi:MFS transporter [Jidongwangia harbinensis]|uniref:MFS transporter n=1 Tax=Jidongwangia harbinensis TaxID=2878561 RepID=UPI001CD93120|nr:MFS transporter [Jidongwangia harbinensis]MCA2218514.1 MFS transporter [Jidongwangia harbinensis]